jgi:hypothetical protein
MRKVWILTCLTMAAVGIYLGLIFESRWRDNQALIRHLEAPAARRNRTLAEAYGGGIRILSFYAVPSTIRRGESAKLCYGAANAESVSIEPPPAEPVWPALSRCVAVTPHTDTDYRFMAKDDQGNARSADLTVTVR